MKKIGLLSLVLCLTLLCGCVRIHFKLPGRTEFTVPMPTVSTVTDVPVDPQSAPVRYQNGGYRDYLPEAPIDMVPFEDLTYERPDTDALYEEFDALTARVTDGAQTDEILETYYSVYDDYYNFYTMDALANIRYSLQTTDSYYKAEYDFCEAESPTVEERFEALMKACANSAYKSELEQQYFGEGYLDDYVDIAVYTNEEYLALAQQEEEVLSRYRSALENPQITYGEKTGSLGQLLETAADGDSYRGILEAYYNKYNAIIAEYYIELIKIRNRIADVLDYDSYADYSYDCVYSRDYTYAQGGAYLKSIREQLVPLYKQLLQSDAYYQSGYSGTTTQSVVAAMDAAVENMGGEIAEAYAYMKAYSLYDLSQSSDKQDSSFTTYLFTYEAPFLTVKAEGTTHDLLTFAHEFGHFTDSFVTYQSEEDLETAETFSQSMEYLMLWHTDGVLADSELESLRQLKLIDTLETFISQAAYADFEDRVYALNPDTLTAQKINDVYRQVARDYGYYDASYDFYYAQSWIDVTHFFEVPYYVISYCVSADTSLQICQLEEAQPQAGLDKFRALLDRQSGAGVQSVMEQAGLENPFDDGRMEEIAAFFREALDLDYT